MDPKNISTRKMLMKPAEEYWQLVLPSSTMRKQSQLSRNWADLVNAGEELRLTIAMNDGAHQHNYAAWEARGAGK
jgi:hypothetical protein